MAHCCGFLLPNDRPALSALGMRQIEDHGVSIGVSKSIMMENAGNAIARFVFELLKEGKSKSRVCLVAGMGNNGGDVFAAARHLSYWPDRFELELILIGNESEIKAEEALTNWIILKEISSIIRKEIRVSEKVLELRDSFGRADLLVVGIFGTGFKGEPRELQREVIRIINDSKVTKVSVDLPSGMEADSGESRFAVRSDYTITMHAPKIGMQRAEARQICGQVLIANIGLPN
jgi:hydroxyethylthiazole kinase-like uncharacterized protein yjeF